MPMEGHKINLIDTPGYEDFSAEVIGALAAVETAARLHEGRQRGRESGPSAPGTSSII
jgi:translation elongation factor EF-G